MSLNKKFVRSFFDREKGILYKKPNQKIILIIVSIIFCLLAWINKPTTETDRLNYKDEMILEETPIYVESHGKNHSSWIKLKFISDQTIYRIESHLFETLNHNKFKDEIKASDTLKIGVINNDIYSLIKNDYEYCDLTKANLKRSSIIYFFRYFTIISLIVLLILKGLEMTKINEYWDIVYIISMSLTVVIVLLL